VFRTDAAADDGALICGSAPSGMAAAVWTLHSFWYPEAAVTEAEPACAMGYWGIAMSHWYPLWFPIQLREGDVYY
jgi:hypothetical protein